MPRSWTSATALGLVLVGSPPSPAEGLATPVPSVVVGYVSGTVTDATTGVPLADVHVAIHDSSGNYVTSGQTDSTGAYTSYSGLLAGTYYARTWNYRGYLDGLYDDFPCALQACTVTSGTPIPVTPGATTAGTDFALSPGGRIRGTVRDAATGLPLAYASVEVFDAAGGDVTYGTTDGTGVYTSFAGLPSGTYYARASQSRYVTELYDDIPCPGLACTVTSGTPIAVTAGATTAAIDFGLTPGGRITGTVRDAVTTAPLANQRVVVSDSAGQYVTDASTDGSGVYTITGLLTSGTYYARTATFGDYIDELYDDISCATGCTVTSGTPISVSVGGTTTGIDFALRRTGRVTGTVRDAVTGQLLANMYVSLFGSGGGYLTSAQTDAFGAYTFSRVLNSGTYYARASGQGYLAVLYDDIPCTTGCTVTSGTPISVTLGATTAGIDFRLSPGGRITGTVRDAVTGQPLSHVFVDIFDSTGEWVTSGETKGGGAYTSDGALVSGTYYAQTGNSDYFYELYDDIPCPDQACTVTSGTPIAVTVGATTAGIDFDLTPGGRVSGYVADAATGQRLAGVSIRIYDSAGSWAAVGYTDSSGVYTTHVGLESGTYYARTENSEGYTDELYRDASCPGGACTVTSGTPISVTVGATTTGIDFGLSRSTRFYTLPPCRVADTRNPVGPWGGPALAANSARTFPVSGLCDVPPTATAVAVNVTVVDPTDEGNLRLYPAGSPAPAASAINFSAGKTRANNAVVFLGADGQIDVRCDMPPGSTGQTHFLFDVMGYFE
jgi:hypothetical protein